jgi:hypothetical protein
MSDKKSVHAHQAVFADKNIVVRSIAFDPATGRLALAIDEKHDNVGLYYVTVIFGSGHSARIDYNGGNSRRNKRPFADTPRQNDTVKGINVVCVRD